MDTALWIVSVAGWLVLVAGGIAWLKHPSEKTPGAVIIALVALLAFVAPVGLKVAGVTFALAGMVWWLWRLSQGRAA